MVDLWLVFLSFTLRVLCGFSCTLVGMSSSRSFHLRQMNNLLSLQGNMLRARWIEASQSKGVPTQTVCERQSLAAPQPLKQAMAFYLFPRPDSTSGNPMLIWRSYWTRVPGIDLWDSFDKFYGRTMKWHLFFSEPPQFAKAKAKALSGIPHPTTVGKMLS